MNTEHKSVNVEKVRLIDKCHNNIFWSPCTRCEERVVDRELPPYVHRHHQPLALGAQERHPYQER